MQTQSLKQHQGLSRSLKVIEGYTDRSGNYDFLLVIHSTIWLSSTVSEMNQVRVELVTWCLTALSPQIDYIVP